MDEPNLTNRHCPEHYTITTQTVKRNNIRKKNLIVAAVQLKTISFTNPQGFLDRAVNVIATAVEQSNANLVLLQELFLGPYFCQSQEASLFALAEDIEASPVIQAMQKLAQAYEVALPISIFERKNNAYYNTVVMIDSDGSILGTYRKSHIPDETGYQEKFYFSPGDTGFQVFSLKRYRFEVGVGICWDQWFLEAARSMALMGADVSLYPTAIGSEPQDPTLDSSDHWQRVIQGHAAANVSLRIIFEKSLLIYTHTITLSKNVFHRWSLS